MPEMPKRNDFIEDYKHLHCNLSRNRDHIGITIIDNDDNDLSDLFKILSKYPNATIEIKNITTLQELNKICFLLGAYDYSGNVIINLTSRINSFASTKNLKNGSFINLEALPCYAKIKGFLNDNAQTDFSTWAHNLEVNDKKLLMNCLVEGDKILFSKQEDVIKSFFDEFKKEYPDILSLSEKERFEKAFMYVLYYFSYADVLDSKGYVRDDCGYSHDAVETYKRREGVCNGRANLLTLVTNNPLLNCNSAVVDGYTEPNETIYRRPMPHCWNVFIDKYDKAFFYDISFKEFTRRDIHNLGKRRIDKVYYSSVQEILDRTELPPRKANTPTLPPKTKSYRPLPKRREEQ